MQKLIIHITTGYCGEDAHDAVSFPNDTTMREIEEYAWEMTCEHGMSYGYESEEDQESFDFSIEVYEPEKHDMHRVGGGSFEDDF